MSTYTIDEINKKYLNYGLKALEQFPKEVLNEVENLSVDFSNEYLAFYENHTNKNIITIDGEKTLDIDDAIYLEKIENLYSLTIYISDVSHYVKLGSKLDEEALKRGTSIYLPNKTINMLPTKLCHDICSLKENKERLTIAINMVYDKKGNLKSKRIFKAIISSKKKMTYDKVTKVLEKSDPFVISEYSNFVSQLFLMKKLALILRKKRKKKYFLQLNIPEFDFFIDNTLKFDKITLMPYKNNISHMIIEEFMLAANFNIAETFYNLSIPFIYRTHDTPNLKKINFNIFLNHKKMLKDESYLLKSLTKKLSFCKQNKKMPLSFNILNCLSSAKYSDVPSIHFALNAKYYCHFTSPIRRYPDLFVHRIISEYLNNGYVTNELIEKYQNLVPKIAQKSSQTEAFAKKVSRELENMYIAYYMQDFIGKNFEATIYKISKNHIYIYIKNVMVTGKIKVSTITNKTNSPPTYTNNKIVFDKYNSFKVYDNLVVTLTDIDKSSNSLIFKIT